jgi:DNA-binding transcriptional regulator YiaG
MKTMNGKLIKWTPEKIRELRKGYGEKQDQFRIRLGISLEGLRAWEYAKQIPGGPAQKLLDRLEEDLLEGKVRDPQCA